MARARSGVAALAAYQADADLRVARRRLGEALPEDGWIAEYLRAVTPLTDTPVEFSLASGLAALAGAIGNRTWIESWGQKVYPHLWAVLVAPSSFWRKSTSINMAERVLRSADASRVLPSDFSRERFLGILSNQPVGLLSLKEFGAFLGMLGRDYSSGLKETMTELYDGPDEYRRSLQKEEVRIQRPAITLLAATTLDWLESRITDGDLRGGFLGRFLFVTATEKSSPKGLTGGIDGLVQLRLKDGLVRVASGEPRPSRFSEEAKDALEDWMAEWEGEVTSAHHAADLTGFAVRLQTYAIKLSMLFRASNVALATEEVEPELVEAADVDQAIAYCRLLWRNVAGLVDEEIAVTKEARELRRIRKLVGPEGIAWSDALRLSHLRARDFTAYVETLVESGALEIVTVAPADVGVDRERQRPAKWLRVRKGSPTVRSSDPSDGANSANHTANRKDPQTPLSPVQSSSSSSYSSHSQGGALDARRGGESSVTGGEPANANRKGPRGHGDELEATDGTKSENEPPPPGGDEAPTPSPLPDWAIE